MSDTDMEEASIFKVAINLKQAKKSDKSSKSKSDKISNKKKKKNNDSDEESTLGITRKEHERQYSGDEDDDDETPFRARPFDDMARDDSMEVEDGASSKKKSAVEPDLDKEEKMVDRVKRYLKILEPLQDPIDFNVQTAFPAEQLEEMLIAMEQLWLPIHATSDKKKERVNEMIQIVETCLGIGENDDPSPYEVEHLMDKHLLEPIHNLIMRFATKDLIRNDTYSRSGEFEGRFQNLFAMQSYAMELYYNFILWSHRAKNPEMDMQESSIGILRYLPRTEQDTYPDFTKFLLYCLLTLQTRRRRRYKGCVYRPVYNEKGYYTNAWEKEMTIEEFVWSAVDLDRQAHMFKIQYSKGAYITEQAIKVLKHIKTSYFPELEPNRYLSSWRNGIYDVGEDKFYPYDEKNPYTLGVQKKEESQVENLEETVDELKKLAEKIPKYKSTFDAIAQNLNAAKKNAKSGLAKEKENRGVLIGSHYCSSIWIDQEFIESDVPSKNAQGQHIKGYWKKIPTHAFEKLLESQEFDEDTRDWIYALTGRGLYWCGQMNKENWQITVLLLGYSGTGKSTILKYLRQFFKTENIGILSNNIERQWAMSSIVDKHIVIGYEVKADFKWDQAEFQQCAACEELLVAQKHRDAFVTQFKSPIFLAANEMIKSWRNNSGSLKRRLVIIPFRHFIHTSKVDPNMMDNLMAEFSLWIQKINKAYREMTSLYGKEDIWSHLSKALIEESERTMQTVHELQHFFQDMGETNRITIQAHDESTYCTWDDFNARFKAWCEAHNYNHSKIRMHDDYWGPVFSTLGLDVKKTSKMIAGSKLPKETKYIIGMAFKDDDEADSFDANDPQGKKKPNATSLSSAKAQTTKQ